MSALKEKNQELMLKHLSISSYKSHLPCVLELKHTSSLSATANIDVIEKLFTNKIGKSTTEVAEAKEQGVFEF